MSAGLGIVGCGYVSDFYLSTVDDYPGLRVIGVHDRIAERAHRVAARHRLRAYATVSELLADERVSIVVNLTNPADHCDITLAALKAGKHVYSEKPLAAKVCDGHTIVEAAEREGLEVSCAPANVLGEAFQTLWREIRTGTVGTPRGALPLATERRSIQGLRDQCARRRPRAGARGPQQVPSGTLSMPGRPG